MCMYLCKCVQRCADVLKGVQVCEEVCRYRQVYILIDLCIHTQVCTEVCRGRQVCTLINLCVRIQVCTEVYGCEHMYSDMCKSIASTLPLLEMLWVGPGLPSQFGGQ